MMERIRIPGTLTEIGECKITLGDENGAGKEFSPNYTFYYYDQCYMVLIAEDRTQVVVRCEEKADGVWLEHISDPAEMAVAQKAADVAFEKGLA